jgi:F-type H+-transporting ATPase subunit b
MLEILGKIGFDWQVALANLINFALVFLVLNYLVFKPLKKVIRERQVKIDEGLENADKARAALVEASSKKDNLIRDAYQESQDIISKAKEEKQKVIQSAEDEASQEASKIRQQANDEAEMILKKADQDLTQKATNLIIAGIEKVAEDKITQDVNEKYITSLLQ